MRKALSGELADRTEVLYVSPLKALSNDIQKNLEIPLGEILQLAGERGYLMPHIRTAVRTGDTLAHERRAMLIAAAAHSGDHARIAVHPADRREEPRNSEDGRDGDRRRDPRRGRRQARLASGAVARAAGAADAKAAHAHRAFGDAESHRAGGASFLRGAGRPEPTIVHIANRRELDLAVEVPGSELGPVASNEMWGEIYDRIAELAKQHRSTLIFVNTRRLAERVRDAPGRAAG